MPLSTAGKSAPGRLASQLRVKLGTIRPATTEIRTTTAASPRRHPRPDGMATPSASRCIKRLATPRTVTGATIGRLRQFWPATISRAATPTRSAGKDRSAAMASHAGTSDETRQARRPSAHSPTSSASGAALTGSRRVQFGIAVQQEAGDGRHHEAEEHFVNCQPSGSNRLGGATTRDQHDDPERQRDRGPECRPRERTVGSPASKGPERDGAQSSRGDVHGLISPRT